MINQLKLREHREIDEGEEAGNGIDGKKGSRSLDPGLSHP